MEREYDIIVWGASGFTGRLVVDYIACLLYTSPSPRDS